MSRRSSHKDLTRSNIAIKARKVLDVASDVAGDIIRLRDKPRIIDYMSIGAKVTQRVIDKFQGEFYDYFDDWYDLDDMPFSELIMKALKKHPTEQVGGHDGYAVMITELYGEEIGWVRQGTGSASSNGQNEILEGPFLKFERLDESMTALGRLMWEELGTTKAVLGTTEKKVYGGNVHATTLLCADNDLNDDVFGSTRAKELMDRIQQFTDHGTNRSVLLLGPPGTGKTTIMKYIATQLNRYTLRINVNELASLKPSIIVEAVRMLKPDVLLIDDFDRFHRNSDHTLLTHLEYVNKSVKVFMVSVNDITEIDPAVVRAGRFDEIEEITRMDPEIVERMLPDGLPKNVHNELLEWPVAYIREFMKRYDVLGPEQALREVYKLKLRIETINNAQYHSLGFDDLDKRLADEILGGIAMSDLEANDGLNEDDLQDLMNDVQRAFTQKKIIG